ncbi:MAG: sigma-70 family RNA polymerase sigma factor [Planctomycetota bacterium]
MDPFQWNRLAEIFGPIVYRWCRSAGVPERDSADTVQEVFAAVARRIDSFERLREQGSFRSWLATITRNKTRDYFRKQATAQIAEGGTAALDRIHNLSEQIESTICPDSIASPVVKQALEHVRNEFEETTFRAFWMMTIEGKTAEDTAAETGISRASCYQAKSRVLRRLRNVLNSLPP